MIHRFLRGACVGLVLLLSAQAELSEQPALPKVRLQLLVDAPKIDAATSQDLLTWLTTLQDVVYRMNIRDYLEMTDWDALVKASYASKAAQPDQTKLTSLKEVLVTAHQRMFPVIRPFFLFMEAEVRRIDVAEDKAVIVARIRDAEGVESKVRWWLQRHGKEWKMADFENITVNMRLSFLMLMGMQAAEAAPLFSKELGAKFIMIGNAAEEGDFEKAYTLMKELESAKLPTMLDEIFLVAKIGVLAQMDGKEGELEESLNGLEKIAPTSPMLYLVRASMCDKRSDNEGTIAWCRKIGASVGHDEETWYMLMEAHRELKQEKDAAAVAQGWAQDYPNSAAAMWSCWQSLPANQREVVVQPLLEKMEPAARNLEIFAESAFDENDLAALNLAIAVMRTRSVPKGIVQEWQANLQLLVDILKDAKPDSK